MRSLRHRFAAASPTTLLLAVVLGLAAAIHGARALAPFHIRGDLLYHWGLTNTILRGAFPPEGPYAELPAYYPPGFHLLLAGVSGALHVGPPLATALLGLIWLPVIPLGAFLLARQLTGRPWVALVAAVLTAFGGAYDLTPDRVWVNSLFMVGQVAVPLYPRDLVFGLLPFAVMALVRALDDRGRWAGWATLAGVLLGACGLIQVQLLLPMPAAVATLALVTAARHSGLRRRAGGVAAITGVVATATVLPWLGYVADVIGRNGGGVSIESAENLLPARFGFWSYPVQFGLVLPCALVGVGVVLLLLRRPDGPRPGAAARGAWRPIYAEAPLVLVPWFAIPFALAVLYQPTWPLEDALRPQRLWLIAGQPAAILAATGLVAAAEDLAARIGRPRLVVPAVVVAILVATVPATAGTLRVLSFTWTDDEYAHLDLAGDRVPPMGELLGDLPGRPTILTYEDWSSLAWYETGLAVVAVKPPGYAKLAFEPAVFTGHGQAERRRDLADALRGDPAALSDVARQYGAERILLARRDGLWGLVQQPAALARLSASSGGARPVDGNGWDGVELAPTGRADFDVRTRGPARVALRFQGEEANRPVPARRFRLWAGPRLVFDGAVPPSGTAEWQVVEADVDLDGRTLAVEAVDRVILQSVTAYVAPRAVPDWAVVRETADAILLGPIG